MKPEKIIISPPFGSWIEMKNATSIKGSFPFHTRKGKWKQAIKTVRYTKRGWINKIGLRNKGVEHITSDIFNDKGSIYSFAIVEFSDWSNILSKLIEINVKDIMIEINISCPNVHPDNDYFNDIKPTKNILQKYSDTFPFISIKLPPHSRNFNNMIIYDCINGGITTFHFSNTLPTEKGGLSGKEVKECSLVQIQTIKTLFPYVEVIGGGGIYTPKDVIDYHNVGADYFSLSTIWFTPWKVPKVIKEISKFR